MFYLLPYDSIAFDLYTGKSTADIYTKPSFYNFQMGFLKNYFQFINEKFEKNESYWLYQDSNTPELKQLKSKTLYVPSYLYKHLYGDEKSKLESLFKNYEFKYELLDDEILNQRILAGEEFYYLRYAKANAEQFLQVINAKNGNIVYTNYISGMSMNLKSGNIKDLSKTISKVK